MDIGTLLSLAQNNARHIATLNREMGEVITQLNMMRELIVWIRVLLVWMLGCMATTFFTILGTLIAVVRNIHWTKKANGKS